MSLPCYVMPCSKFEFFVPAFFFLVSPLSTNANSPKKEERKRRYSCNCLLFSSLVISPVTITQFNNRGKKWREILYVMMYITIAQYVFFFFSKSLFRRETTSSLSKPHFLHSHGYIKIYSNVFYSGFLVCSIIWLIALPFLHSTLLESKCYLQTLHPNNVPHEWVKGFKSMKKKHVYFMFCESLLKTPVAFHEYSDFTRERAS